jgi:hypothetical protein
MFGAGYINQIIGAITVTALCNHETEKYVNNHVGDIEPYTINGTCNRANPQRELRPIANPTVSIKSVEQQFSPKLKLQTR